MRKLLVWVTVMTLLGLIAVGEKQATAYHITPPPCNYAGNDGVIGAEWTGVTPTFVQYEGFSGDNRGGQLVAFNVYARADAYCFYMAFEAVPQSGDRWGDASALGLGSSANIYLDTDVNGTSDLILLTLNGDYCEAPNCNNVVNYGNPAFGPHVWNIGNDGAPPANGFAGFGGVREVALPWDTLQTDPDGVGFALTKCAVNLRTVQAFGYNFSGSQFPNRFGTYSQPGCVGVPTHPKDLVTGTGTIMGFGDPVVHVNASRNPSTSAVGGRFYIRYPGAAFEVGGRVTCLTVNVNKAGVGGVIERVRGTPPAIFGATTPGNEVLITVLDMGEPGTLDEVNEGQSTGASTNCPSTGGTLPIKQGNYVVHSDPPLDLLSNLETLIAQFETAANCSSSEVCSGEGEFVAP